MLNYHEDTVVAWTKLLRKADGTTLATFSSLAAATHCANMLREGNLVSARWATNGATTSGDRTTFDALARV